MLALLGLVVGARLRAPGRAGPDAFTAWALGELPRIPVVPGLNPVLLGLAHAGVPGGVLEFGVFQATSTNLIAGQRALQPVYGFDSFEGLPDDWMPGFPKGYFDMQGMLPPVAPNVVLVKGWFNETLPPFLAAHPEPASFVHIDCDMYESTRTVLTELAPRIGPGTVLVFDELVNYPSYLEHELKAFYEFLVQHGHGYQWLGTPCPINPTGQVASCAGMGCCSVAVVIV